MSMATAIHENSAVYLMDCIEGMKQYEDNHFDLAVVDPPYGIGFCNEAAKDSGLMFSGMNAAKSSFAYKDWDSMPPSNEYFDELFRVSKNQIIWGANYFITQINKNSACWIVWDKVNSGTNFADCELAWTSFKSSVRQIEFMWNGMLQGSQSDGRKPNGNKKSNEKRIHPTQKPVRLYDWIFDKYAEAGFKILDTHLGSGSSRIAAAKHKLDFTGFEIDEDYFIASNDRFQQFISQTTLF